MASIDLNLLRVFDVLHEERSVTRTASRLGVTQSAVSHALRRLREVMDDPLFVRGPAGLQPTARASQIAPDVQRSLANLHAVFSRPLFEPGTSARRFNLAASSYFCAMLVPRLIARARAVAPLVTFRIWSPGADLPERLDQGLIDLAFTGPERRLSRIRSAPLFDDEVVWVARADNALAGRPVTPAEVLAAPLVTIRSLSELVLPPSLDPRGRAHGERRKHGTAEDPAAIIVYDAATALGVVALSDAVAQIPRRIVSASTLPNRIAILQLDEPPRPVSLQMRWHAKADNDPGLKWLRELVAETQPAW